MNSDDPKPRNPSTFPHEGNAASLLREALEHTLDQAVPVEVQTPSGVIGSGDLPLPEELARLLPHGNYAVESFLGQGGMGAVYKGTQVRLKRPVAIKIMRRDRGKDHDFEARFEREAQAMAKLNHPNIVSVIDYGEAGQDYLYIVMELIDGADLMDVIRTGRMTQEMALTLLPQICDALQFAHDHGIVHRDIKPSNIMLTRDGRIKMADFGLAKRFDAESSFRTQTGAGMGTPDYAAPEQFNDAGVVDHRADIYALGVMIYQMITGTLPRGVWKPPSQRAEVAPQWDEIVRHAMEGDPKDRYQSASEIKTDVTRITPRQSSASRRVRVAPKSRAPLLFGIIGSALVIVGGAFFMLKRPGATSEPSVSPSTASASPNLPVSSSTSSATKDVPFINSLGMKFVPVPDTKVLFCIHETRRQDYAAYAAAAPGVDESWKHEQREGIPVGDKDEHPVCGVSWEQAQAFCVWLNKNEGKTYRLPTDEEWSIAVGLGRKEKRGEGIMPEMLSSKETREFPWGGSFPPKTQDLAGNYADNAWHEKFPTEKYLNGYDDGFPTTAPVMSFTPNRFGIYDMGGNVREWVEDWWNAVQKDRVLRGGAFNDDDERHLLSSDRARHSPSSRLNDRGFRCVLVVR